MIRIIILLLMSSLIGKEVFSGNSFMDKILLESKLNVLIKPKCAECTKLISELEKAKIDYNVLQTVTLVWKILF